MKGRLIRWGAALLFLLAVWLPMLQMRFGFFEQLEFGEKRELAPFPKIALSSLGDIPKGFESYFADNFGLRINLIRFNNFWKINLLGVSPISSLILGKDSWLFYRSEALDDGNSINDHRGTIPLSPRELAKLKEKLEKNHEEFSKLGIAYLVVIVPNKNTIYEEYLPDGIRKNGSRTRLDQLMEYLGPDARVRVLDLRAALLKAKTQYPTYLKTDSHWNSYGAYVGYAEIMKELGKSLGNVCPPPVEGSCVSIRRSLPGGDLAQMLFMEDMLPEDNTSSLDLPPEAPEGKIPSLLFRHDSFGDNLYPYLKKRFKRIVGMAPFVPYRLERIRADRPQVILHVFAERYITTAIHDDFFYKEDGT